MHIYLLFSDVFSSISHAIKKVYYQSRNLAILDARIEKREVKESWIVIRADYRSVMN